METNETTHRRAAGEPKGRLLVVDDEPAVARGLRYAMRRYQLVPAGSVDEAISILEVDRYFDLILCDVMMPRRLGVELYTWVEEQHPSLLHRVVLMTGGIRDSRVRDAIMQGSYLVLLKPFDSVVLRLLVADRGMARPERSRSPATEPARGARLTKRLRTIGNSTFIR